MIYRMAGQSNAESDLCFSVPVAELIEVYERIAGFCAWDEQGPLGYVLLAGSSRGRRWLATDSCRAAWMDFRDHAAPDHQVLVSPRALGAAIRLSSDQDEHVDLFVEAEELVVRAGLGEVRLPVRTGYPDMDDTIARFADEPYIDARTEREVLQRIVELARQAPAGAFDEDRPFPLFWVDIKPSDLTVTTAWEGFSESQYRCPCRADGSLKLALNPKYLADFLSVCGGEEVHLLFPADRRGPVMVMQPDWSGMLMPLDTTPESLRPRLEQLLATRFSEVPPRGVDGSYCVAVDGHSIYVRLIEGDPDRVQVAATAVQHLERSPELLTELNSINADTAFVRAVWIDNRIVVEVELVAATLDAAELNTAVDAVCAMAVKTGPTLALVFGAGAAADSFTEEHRRTLVRCPRCQGQSRVKTSEPVVRCTQCGGTMRVPTKGAP